MTSTFSNKDFNYLEISALSYDICERLPCGLVVINAQGRVAWANKVAQGLLGNDLKDSVWLDIIKRSFAPKEDDGYEISLVDGRRISVAISSLDSLPGELVTLTDLTTTRQYEQEKAEYGRFLALGRMTAQLAHQIRTPLSSAMLYTEHLTNPTVTQERMAKWIMRIQECHTSIEKQIQDLLLFARGETIELVAVNVLDWGKELEKRIHSLALPSSVQLTINNQLLSGTYYLHTESLIGAVLNLITNAIQAKASCIELMLSYTGSNLIICVRDNGCGMTESVKVQAFSPFFTTKAKGTGLGLAVVKAVVKAHHGEITLDSSPGQGCCIKIKLSQ
ncbi:sensor histidine kinase [Legionella beliardensis]|uniref:histidine kinase n=1 Tax=Legionella beliardensis TaxID=91822 RepID=A0A378I3U2_9GAMM|nr:HAMP domain-containing sensor histidine kinase [Legionella beliardensis]STX29385.1 sensor histidine kinase [Legionella beliardensis]